MSEKRKKLTRRAFLITGGVAGTGLLVGIGGLRHLNKKIQEFTGTGFGTGTTLNAYVHIHPDNAISLAIPKAEMGQGVYTSLPALIAEELEVEMSSINVVYPQSEGPYANLWFTDPTPRTSHDDYSFANKIASYFELIGTGGSTSVKDSYNRLRMMGAQARELLIKAGAKHWNVAPSDLYAEKGHVVNKATNDRIPYGDLAEAAAQEKIKEAPLLKEPKDFKLIGKPLQRLDIPDKVIGKAKFGLDARPEGLLFAAMRHPSIIGGKITKITNREKVESLPGVKAIVEMEEGVAVVADNTHRAIMATKIMQVEEEGDTSFDNASVMRTLKGAFENEPTTEWETRGEGAAVVEGAEDILEAEYYVPFLAHACMEPLNCTVKVEGDQAMVWVGHQSTLGIMDGVKNGAGIKKDNIKFDMLYLGGGFGRRAEIDFVTKAAKVAKAMEGTPVQLVFTREEAMSNDMYRPAVLGRFKASFKDGAVHGWSNAVASQASSSEQMKRIAPAFAPEPAEDDMTVEGAINLPYDLKNLSVYYHEASFPIMVGSWRSVGHSQNAFFTESFMDECAAKLEQDPYEFRRALLGQSPRFKAVLEKAAEISGWSTPLPEGKGRGIALHKSFDSIVAEVVELTVQDKEVKVDKVFCVIDCGRVVNPDTVETQMQSGIVYGLTAAMYGEINIEEGAVVEKNFPQYRMVQMQTMPAITVHIMDVDEYPGGVGEPSTPPIAPAVCNALAAASGDRVRSLPLKNSGYTFV
ncbi:MAG: molybdopterin cofactor-binding domain-containing protein [Bacteroidota bacterium]